MARYWDKYWVKKFGFSFGNIRFNSGHPYTEYHIGFLLIRIFQK